MANSLFIHVIVSVSDCQEVLRYFYPTSGVYVINPDATTRPFEVFCEMIGEEEGWTVIQRRQTGTLDFFRGKRRCVGSHAVAILFQG